MGFAVGFYSGAGMGNKGNLNYTVFVGSAAVTQFWFHGNFVAEYVLFIQEVNSIK